MDESCHMSPNNKYHGGTQMATAISLITVRESCIYECVMSQIWMGPVKQQQVPRKHSHGNSHILHHSSWFKHMCDVSLVTTHLHVWHDSFTPSNKYQRGNHLATAISPITVRDSFICVTCLIYICDMTHSDMWHDSFKCVTRLIHMCDMTHSYLSNSNSTQHSAWLIHMCDVTHSNLLHTSFICVAWLIHMSDMTHSYLCNGNSTQHSPCLIHMCDMTHSHVLHTLFISVIWVIHMCDMSRSHVSHDSFICVTWLTCTSATTMAPNTDHDTYICVTWLIQICYIPHSYVAHDSLICVTWLPGTSATAISPKTVSKNLAMLRVVATCMWLSSWRIHVCDRSWLIHMCQHSLEEFSHVACCCHLWMIEFVAYSRACQIVTHSYASTQSRRI